MEDWVEQLHQAGMPLQQHFCTVQNPVVRPLAQEMYNSHLLHPAHTDATNAGNKQSFSVAKVDNTIFDTTKKG